MAPPPIQSRWAQIHTNGETDSDSDNENNDDIHADNDNGNSSNLRNQTDGAAERALDDETRHRNMVAMQMIDLGSTRREHITTTEAGPRRPQGSHVAQRILLSNRRVNQEDTPESEAFEKNKATIQGWNSYHTTVKDEDFERLDSLMNGQTHRARLNETLQQVGGQHNYFGREAPARSSIGAAPIPRGGSAVRGGRGGGIAGTRGRGSFPLPAGRPVPASGGGYRPLDPAVEGDREYGYKSSRSGARNRRGTDRPQFSMVGNTVRLGPSSSNRPMARPLRAAQQPMASGRRAAPPVSKPPPPPKRATPATDQSSKWDMLLDPVAFMKAISATKDREFLNKQVPPASVSTTADAAKTTLKNANKPSSEQQKEQLRKIAEPVPRMTNVPRSEIRRVPTHEFTFPAPVLTTNQEANDAAYTDGVPSPESFCSAQTSQMQSPEPLSAPFVFEGNNEGSVIGLGIDGLPASAEASVNHNAHGIILSDIPRVPYQTTSAPAEGSCATQQAAPSQAAPDLMDQDIDDFSQETLSPVSAETPGPTVANIAAAEPPPFVEVHGIRYYRAEALPHRPDRQSAAQATSQAAAQLPAAGDTTPDVAILQESAIRVSDAASQSRILTTSGYSIGGNLGDHNLPRRNRVDSVVQTTPTLESRWSTASHTTASSRSSRPIVSNPSRPVVTPAMPAPEQSRPARIQASPPRHLRSTGTAASRSAPTAVPGPTSTDSVASTVPVLFDPSANGPVSEGSGWHRLPRPARSISASTHLSQSTHAQVQVPETVAIGSQNLPGRGRGNSAARMVPNIELKWSTPAVTESADPANTQRGVIGDNNLHSTALGDHNLPGRGRGGTTESSAAEVQSKWVSSFESLTNQLRTLSPPSRVLPQRLNPFAFSTSADVTENVRATTTSRTSAIRSAGNLASSRWGDPTAVVQTRNDSSANHPAGPINPFAESSGHEYNAAPARQPRPTCPSAEPVLDYGEPPRSSAASTRSPDVTISSTSAAVAPTNTPTITQPPTETYEQRLVRAMNSYPAAGMTPFGGTQNLGLNRGRTGTSANSPFRRRNVRTQPGPGFPLMMETAKTTNNMQPTPASPTRPLSENTTRANTNVASSAHRTAKEAEDAENSSGESEL